MNAPGRVTVLMSTCNGERYIAGQIESIIAQTGVPVDLMIRDDGSTDHTREIISEYAVKHDNITFLEDDEKKGVGNSFMTLLRMPSGSEYFAYSDQDDIWYPDKLETAVKALEKTDGPALYCCNQNCVDSGGSYLHRRFGDDLRGSSLIRTVFNNYFAGCTMVMNRELRDIIISEEHLPDESFFRSRIHDSWTACAAYAAGKVIYDPKPHMDFRRHEGAYSDEYAPGSEKSTLKMYHAKWKRFVKRGAVRHSVKLTACNLLRYYGTFLKEDDKRKLEMICAYDRSMLSRIRFLCSPVFNDNVMGTRGTAVMKILAGIY